MYLGISSSLQHGSPEEGAAKHKFLGLECVNFPVNCDEDAETIMAYKRLPTKPDSLSLKWVCGVTRWLLILTSARNG